MAKNARNLLFILILAQAGCVSVDMPTSSVGNMPPSGSSTTTARGGQPSGRFVSGPSMEHDPQIVTTLLQLMDVKDNSRPTSADFTNSGLKDLITLGTPGGFQLRNRYLYLGVSLSQNLETTTDPRLKEQALELARWERNPDIRAVGLLSLAARKDPAHQRYFEEALVNIQPEIRFAALEALELWDLPQAKGIFEKQIRQDLSPMVKVYAAQALARRGGDLGLQTLREQLESSDWIARAMSARFLGDLGTGDDYDRVLNRMPLDRNNDFMTAELAIAALKLFPKKPQATAPNAPPQQPGQGTGGGAGYVELDPLVITAPRLKIPPTALIDGRINAELLRLLDTRASSRPTEEQLLDPSLKDLNSLASPVGFQLKTRYTELGFLLTEGLAGTTDLNLRNRIVSVARSGTNPQVRAAALVAIAYDKDPGDRDLFQQAFIAQEPTLRFGAMEAMHIWGQQSGMADIGNVARLDQSGPLRIYAAGMMLRAGDAGGRDILIRGIDDLDWVVRAMSNRYLGEMGIPDDFDRILFRLPQEQNNFVKSEMCGALLRLFALRQK